MDVVLAGAQVGLLFGPLALGIYLAIGVMSLPDLTLEGSFGVGGAIAAVMVTTGHGPIQALLVAACGGALMGCTTALLHLWLRLNVLLAGILMTSAAWSIVLVLMGAGNLSLFGFSTIFDTALDSGLDNQWATIVVAGAISVALGAVLVWFLMTDYGLSMRATGLNIQTARGMGVRTESRQVVGLMIANALAATSGVLVVQSQGFMDVTIQTGTTVVGLAALMIGRSLWGSPKLVPSVIAVISGAVIYRFIVSMALELGLAPNLLKLVTTVIVLVVVAVRANGPLLVAPPFTKASQRARRRRIQFYEDDYVANII